MLRFFDDENNVCGCVCCKLGFEKTCARLVRLVDSLSPRVPGEMVCVTLYSICKASFVLSSAGQDLYPLRRSHWISLVSPFCPLLSSWLLGCRALPRSYVESNLAECLVWTPPWWFFFVARIIMRFCWGFCLATTWPPVQAACCHPCFSHIYQRLNSYSIFYVDFFIGQRTNSDGFWSLLLLVPDGCSPVIRQF